MSVRIVSTEPLPGGALRVVVALADGTVIHNCHALRRRRDGRWKIEGPALHTRGGWVPLATFSPQLREAIAAALDATIAIEVAA